MARSLPKVKRTLEKEENKDLLANYISEFAVNLRKYVVAPFKQSFPYLMPMWKTQLFLAILDS